MTDAERQARYRAAQSSAAPATRIRPTDNRSQAKRWRDAVSELTVLQKQYAAWRDALPPNLRDSVTAEALDAICDVELEDLQAIDPPRGFGRD